MVVTKEVWKPIKGFEGLYEISNFGRVKSLARKPGKGINKQHLIDTIKKQSQNQYGYRQVGFQIGKKHYCKQVHRLVSEAFIKNPKNKPCVNHKDGNKQNNHITNLEWCTYKENSQHAFRIGICDHRRGESCYNSTLKEYQVRKIKTLYPKYTYNEIAKIFNVGSGVIWNIINGKNWKHVI